MLSICFRCRIRLLRDATIASAAIGRRYSTSIAGSGAPKRSSPSDLEASMLDTYEKLLAGDEKVSPKDGYHSPFGAPRFAEKPAPPPSIIEDIERRFHFPAATHRIYELLSQNQIHENLGKTVVVHGFIRDVRKSNAYTCFANIYDSHTGIRRIIQLCSFIGRDEEVENPAVAKMHKELLTLRPFTPVAVSGVLRVNKKYYSAEIHIDGLWKLNSVDKEIIYTPETVYPPSDRHLQLRTNESLAKAIRLRAEVASYCRKHLDFQGFVEVETPLLFKSTPEGAREFLVPTRRRPGECYALPQSPQQYKQILMASGIPLYYQLAKCFRDEDLRADRQPEFTQLDIEMSFATSGDVMSMVEVLIHKLWSSFLYPSNPPYPFRRMSYIESMKFYGTDKPDLRLPDSSTIFRIILNDNRSYEGFILRPHRDSDPSAAEALHRHFRDTICAGLTDTRSYIANETTANGIPTLNFSASDIELINEKLRVIPGDLVVLKPRSGPYIGGSTPLGALRTALFAASYTYNVLEAPSPKVHRFLWITDFPLFTPTEPGEGQGGKAGWMSTHHPFTAPHLDDFELLLHGPNPGAVRGAHYDLVVNGMELGGGSRRIHDAALQRWVLEEVLKVPEEGVREFDHLLKVLESGCPPHAGIALGFDRLIAVMAGMPGVRETIAFPKDGKGRDLMVGSPGVVAAERLGEYGLEVVGGREAEAEEVKAEEAKVGKVKAEELTAEEVTAQEVKTEEVTAEEVTAQEVTAEEVGDKEPEV